ncbi:MAG: undecaprenyl-diphosphate phosphatase [Pleurocapsa minor HA4230-MV1]|jgi:undecaprenyl-diphosphatase|nr:undecaprenyl-diphosphate phosphatase [Pleurocapsa minor HA4230-MV1]
MSRKTNKYTSLLYFLGFGLIFSLIFNQLDHNLALASSPELLTQNPKTAGTTQVNLFQAIVLGFVQGATEFIPISSTAHLKAIPVFFGWDDPGVSFTAVIQLGSIAAVISYFWSDLSQIVKGIIKAIRHSNYESQDFLLAVGLALGSLPLIFAGLLLTIFEPPIYETVFRSMPSIAIVSIVMASLLALAEYVGTQKRNFEDLTVKDGVLIGFAQALAIIPGVSRSGSTMTASLFNNIDRASAARFSFLLGIPAITAAGLVGLKDLIDTGGGDAGFLPLIAGLISSTVFSYLAIAWLLEFLKRRSTWVFVWYRLGFGVFILVALALGWIKG